MTLGRTDVARLHSRGRFCHRSPRPSSPPFNAGRRCWAWFLGVAGSVVTVGGELDSPPRIRFYAYRWGPRSAPSDPRAPWSDELKHLSPAALIAGRGPRNRGHVPNCRGHVPGVRVPGFTAKLIICDRRQSANGQEKRYSPEPTSNSERPFFTPRKRTPGDSAAGRPLSRTASARSDGIDTTAVEFGGTTTRRDRRPSFFSQALAILP